MFKDDIALKIVKWCIAVFSILFVFSFVLSLLIPLADFLFEYLAFKYYPSI